MRGAARLAANQRRARRRMLLRGRITIAIGLGALVLLLCQFGVSNPLIPCPEKAPSVEVAPT